MLSVDVAAATFIAAIIAGVFLREWVVVLAVLVLIIVGLFLVVMGVVLSIAGTAGSPEDRAALFFVALFVVIIAAMVLGARYLRNQRERIDLTTNAEELKRALQRLRQRAGDVETVTVPSELLEQTAKIESAQIATQRRDAILQSSASPSKEYAVAFDHGAVEQRATLDIADRVELEDLVEQLSADAAELESRGAGAGVTAALRAATKSKRIEVNYLVDQASKRIRIAAIKQTAGGSATFDNGSVHA
jgi:membrane protein implicated in regulation of membrane protease activity